MSDAAIATLPDAPSEKVVTVFDEMKSSYLDYAMSVIVSRALPDARDGLKPVHRRILYGATAAGFVSTGAYKKSARIVGDVMGTYHPHGDASIYDAMVKMVQPFYMRVPLVDGQGNFGSVDGDPPAAMRYSEARMAKITDAGMTRDVELRIRNTDLTVVGWQRNYDDSSEEPVVLPVRFPNLLVNGAQGIAVGMATNMPSHNLGETIAAALAYLADPDISIEDLMRVLPGPDFPTGGVVMGRAAIRAAYETGRGSIMVSGVAVIEKSKAGRETIVLTQLPYGVNKQTLVERIAELASGRYKDKAEKDRGIVLEGIQDVNDESSLGEGMRVAVLVKKDSDASTVLVKLRKHTRFMESFGVNSVALNKYGVPEVMGLKRILEVFIEFRRETVAARTRVLLESARVKYERQVGFYAARDRIDEVIAVIRGSSDRENAAARLREMSFENVGELAELVFEIDPDVIYDPVFRLNEDQVEGILDMRLGTLSRLALESIATVARDLLASRRAYLEILNDPATLDAVVRTEMLEIGSKFSTPRLTVIENEAPGDIEDDELVELRSIILTMTQNGYVKWTPLDSFREQARGGKGKSGMDTADTDVVSLNLVCTTRSPLLFFTSRGKVHTIRAYKIPEAAANAKGRPVQNFVPLEEGEKIASVLAMPLGNEGLEDAYLMFVTDKGDVRRNAASDFTNVNRAGKIAMKLDGDDGLPIARLLTVAHCRTGDDLVLGTSGGKGVRFSIDAVRVFKSRDSTGMKGVSLSGADDRVVGACVIDHFETSSEERMAFFGGGSHRWKDPDGVEMSHTLTDERMLEMRAAERMILTVSSRGYGKRFSSHDFRTTNRGAQGVTVGTFGTATGNLVALVHVEDSDGLILVTDDGQTIRTRADDIRTTGRSARGVRLFGVGDGRSIVSVARIQAED